MFSKALAVSLPLSHTHSPTLSFSLTLIENRPKPDFLPQKPDENKALSHTHLQIHAAQNTHTCHLFISLIL